MLALRSLPSVGWSILYLIQSNSAPLCQCRQHCAYIILFFSSRGGTNILPGISVEEVCEYLVKNAFLWWAQKKRSLGLFTPNIYWVLESIGANPTSLRHWCVCKRLMSSAETSINKPAVIAACRQCRNWANFRTFKYGTEAILDLSDVLLMLSGKELWSNL